MNRHSMTAPSLRRGLGWMLLLLVGLWIAGCGTGALPVPVDLPTPTPFVVEATATPAPTSVAQPVTLRYALWDPNQVPAYQACADQFMAANPLISVDRAGGLGRILGSTGKRHGSR